MTDADLLRRQWTTLLAWLRDHDALAVRDLPSGLGEWSIGDLVAHLGLGIGMVADIAPAPEGAQPLSLGRYVALYPPAATAIADMTRRLADELGDDVLGGIDAMADRAWAALERSADDVVQGRRGPLLRSDYLTTRLIELVVHGDDLRRALPGGPPSPVLPEAGDVVARALADAYRERAGHPHPAGDGDPLAWVRLAAGREPTDDPALPLL